MKTLLNFVMPSGFLLMLSGLVFGVDGAYLSAVGLAISGSILIGSSLIALAILKTSDKNGPKPE